MSQNQKEASISSAFVWTNKLSILMELFKMRLNLMVVVSSVLGYFIGMETFSWSVLLSLMLGGFLVTGASNAMNQIIEREHDAKMNRTKERPLPTQRISVWEAWLMSAVSGAVGILLLWFMVNPLTGILAALSLFVYVVLYTPMKRVSNFSVFVGAFPGAIPPMLGWVAATGYFGLEAGLLFAIQFMWQFPHFWAIAWISNDDYNKAGFRMLPSSKGKNEFSSMMILLYALMLIPVSMTPLFFDVLGIWSSIFILLSGILFAIPAMKLHNSKEDKHAKKLMFASFLYLPLVLLAFFIDKLF